MVAAAVQQALLVAMLVGAAIGPLVVAFFMWRAARTLQRETSGTDRRLLMQGMTGVTVGALFHIVFVGWLSVTGRIGAMLVDPLGQTALLAMIVLGGLGASFLVIWLGVMHGLLRRSGSQSIELQELNRKLRHRTEELEEFSYAVSHDLRSPLISVRWLLDDLEVEKDPAQQAHLQRRLQVNLDRMEALIEDLLLLAQVEREGMTHEEVRVDEIATETEEALSRQARLRDIQIELETVATTAFLPRTRLRQITQNLVANAVQHAPEGGRIWIRALPADDDEWIGLEVEDDGPGVPVTEREMIFQAFSQGSTRRDEGRGIGLALVRKIARAYGGSVWVTDGAHGGARFCVQLPGTTLPEEAEPHEPPATTVSPHAHDAAERMKSAGPA